MKPFCFGPPMGWVLAAVLMLAPPPARAATPGFTPAPDGGFTFDTGVLRGRLHRGGKALGLQEVTHVPTGRRIDRSNGLLSHYRVFTTGKRHGDGAWDWPGTARLREDGAVVMEWPPAAGRPFTLGAVYQIRDAQTVDLQTTVKAEEELPGFEAFVASYFEEHFTNAMVAASVTAGGDARNAGAGVGFVRASVDAGAWQIYPRDEASLALIRDGRWKLEPHPVDWVERPLYQRALVRRRAPASGLSGLLMARSEDCFAVSLPHEAEGHCSVYLSLFGRTVAAGETARAWSRLMVVAAKSDGAVLALHEAAVKEWKAARED